MFSCSNGNISFLRNGEEGVMLRELPQFYMFSCSNGNISFLRNGEEAKK
jgi:hypothetical protein